MSFSEEIKTKAVILALGRCPKKLNEESERLLGKGVSYCSLCDGALYKNEDVAIIGGGNSALEEAIYLSSICKSVSILNRSDSLKGDKLLIDKVNNTKNIKVYLNTDVTKFNKNGDILNSLELIIDNKKDTIFVKACFIFIGYEPATNFLKELDILDEKGEYNYKTSLNDLKVIVDAGSGHNVSKKIKLQEQKNSLKFYVCKNKERLMSYLVKI